VASDAAQSGAGVRTFQSNLLCLTLV